MPSIGLLNAKCIFSNKPHNESLAFHDLGLMNRKAIHLSGEYMCRRLGRGVYLPVFRMLRT